MYYIYIDETGCPFISEKKEPNLIQLGMAVGLKEAMLKIKMYERNAA